MAYAKQTWVDGSGGGTPINATRLNYIEAGIETAAAAGSIVGLSTSTSAGTANASLIQAAIDAATAAGGGNVRIPRGAYTSAPLVMKSGVRLIGEGPYGTKLTLANGANAHFVTIATVDTDRVGFIDLWLDGNKANQTGAVDVVYLNNTGYNNAQAFPSPGDPTHYMERVFITNGKRHGINTAGEYSGAQFKSVHSYLSGENNFYIASPDNNFVDCVSAKSGYEGFYIASNSERLINCKAWLAGQTDDTRGDGFRVANVSRTDLIGCEAQDNRNNGFTITGCSNVHLVGRADRNGLGPEPATGFQGDGIYAESLIDSRIDLIAGDRAAGADGNVGGGVTIMQRWAYNCGPNNNGNHVTITSGTSASGNVGNGSWGANSIVTITHKGVPVQVPTTPLPATTQTGTTYTFALADQGTVVESNNAAAVTFTVPPNASVAFPVGTVIEVHQLGAGQVTLAPGAGVTLRSRGPALKIAGQYGVASLRKRAVNEWVVGGDLTA